MEMMKLRAASLLATVLATLLLGACTPMQWERDGLALDTGGTDWSDCRRQSIAFANRWGFNTFPYSYLGRDAHGRAFSYYRPYPYPDRFMLERDYLDNCLRARGFRLVPVPPADAKTPGPAVNE
jgi:hypothetical protein